MITSFNAGMQSEKIAVIALVVIIVGALSVYLLATYGEDIFDNLFGENGETEPGAIALGDCVDVNYIGRHASNGTVFDSSYEDVENKTGGIPLQMFVSINSSETPPKYGYMGIIEGLAEGLVGLKENDTATIGPIPPEKAYGIRPKVGDILNLTELAGTTYVYKIVKMQENATMPAEIEQYFGNGTTTLYVLREDWHYIGEILTTSPYLSWENSSIVTKLNETLLWIYTSPSNEIGENFTWSEFDISNGETITFPEKSSNLISLNETSIVITHNPQINSTINVVMYGGYYTMSYVIGSVTNQTINASYVDDASGDTLYKEFDRQITIPRNETQNITMEIPEEYLEVLLSQIRDALDNFNLSLDTLAGESLIFDVEIVKVYKTSQEES